MIGDMGGYGRQPINGVKIFFLPVILRSVDNLRLFREIGHSVLRERGPDDIAGQVAHCLFFSGMDLGAAKDLKTRMFLRFKQINMNVLGHYTQYDPWPHRRNKAALWWLSAMPIFYSHT